MNGIIVTSQSYLSVNSSEDFLHANQVYQVYRLKVFLYHIHALTVLHTIAGISLGMIYYPTTTVAGISLDDIYYLANLPP